MTGREQSTNPQHPSGRWSCWIRCSKHGQSYRRSHLDLAICNGRVRGAGPKIQRLEGQATGGRWTLRLTRFNGSVEEWRGVSDQESVWGTWRDVVVAPGQGAPCLGSFRIWPPQQQTREEEQDMAQALGLEVVVGGGLSQAAGGEQ